MDTSQFALAPLWYVTFLFQLTCHEAAHAVVGRWGGDETAALGGQASLNPIPHIRQAPFGTILVPGITLLLVGYPLGWALAPYDPIWANRHPHRAARMALAGPVANFLLALLSAIALRIGLSMGAFYIPAERTYARLAAGAELGGGVDALATFLSMMLSLNVILGVFNLLPAPPLDGSTGIGLLVSEERARKIFEFMAQPGMSMIGLLVAWQVAHYAYFPVLRFMIELFVS